MATARNAAEILEDMAETFRERNAVYGDNYKMVGKMMAVLFPEGAPPSVLHSDQFHLFELILVKLSRFAISDLKHVDSIHDSGVYCAMIEAIITSQCSTCSVAATCGVENEDNMTSGNPCDFYKEKQP